MSTIILFFLTIFFITSCNNLNTIDHDEQYLKIHLHHGYKDEINTFDNQLQKDLIADGVITTEFYFSTEELFRIEEMVYQVDFFALPDTLSQLIVDSIAVIQEPNPGTQFLRIEQNEQDKTVYWFYPVSQTETAPKLLRLKDLIIEIVEESEAYQNLPQARGGYL